MSDSSQTSESITVDDQGIKIEKHIDESAIPVAIRFTIESTFHEPLSVKLIDDVPPDLITDSDIQEVAGKTPDENNSHIGLHEDFHGESWTRHEDGYLTFEHTISPGDSIQTFYAVDVFEDYPIEEFLNEPQIVETTSVVDSTENEEQDNHNNDKGEDETEGKIDDEDANEDEVTEENDSSDSDNPSPDESGGFPTDFSNETTSSTESDVEETVASDETEEDENSESKDPSEDRDWSEGFSAEVNHPDGKVNNDSNSNSAENGSHDVTDGSVTDELISELQSESISDKKQKELASLLLQSPENPDAVDTRLQYAESRLSELESYINVLETFLDTSGTAAEVMNTLSSLEQTVDELNDRVETIENTPSDNDSDLETTVEELEETVEELASWRNAMTSALDN